MKNNYPIRYALVPMIEQTGWIHGIHDLERNYEIVCYILAKCYLVKETKNYNIKGNTNTSYYVVCPYYIDEFKNIQRQEPSFNVINDYCTNSIITDKLFYTYEEALEARNIKNEELFHNQIKYLCFDDIQKNYNYFLKKHNNKVNYYLKYEEEIELKLTDLDIFTQPNEQTLIMFNEDKYKKLDKSLYEIIDIFDKDDYTVYSLSLSDYNDLKNKIKDKDFKINKDYEVLLQNDGKTSITNIMPNKNIGKYLYKGKIYDGKTDPNIKSNGIKFYSIEDYEDIINSFSYSKNNIQQKKLIKK